MISLRNIHKSFGNLEVLKGIDLDIQKGEMVSIVGPSGAGKTTLLQIMGTLDRPNEGTLTIANTDVTRYRLLPSPTSEIPTSASFFSFISSFLSSPRSKMS